MGPSGSLNSLDFVIVFSRHSVKFPEHGCLVLLDVPQVSLLVSKCCSRKTLISPKSYNTPLSTMWMHWITLGILKPDYYVGNLI